jgi:pimeloyl-ACP methyl ester carboxylesterase
MKAENASNLETHASLHEDDRFVELKDGISICYRSYGREADPTIVLIAGLTLQLHYWAPEFVQPLLQAGYRVIVLDNRDIGRSTRHTSPPLQRKHLIFGKGRPEGYSLRNMAGDVIGVLDHLGIEKIHVVGMSMGGMIAQEITSHYPSRVLTLTSIFSTTGSKKVGQPSLKGKLKLMKARPRERELGIAHYLDHAYFIAGNRYKVVEATAKDYAAKAWDRGNGAKAGAGISRQIGAIFNSGDRTPHLRNIKVPTLVIHGDKDPLVNPTGGYATADAIPKAKLVLVPGMGHYISAEVSPMLTDLLLGHVGR